MIAMMIFFWMGVYFILAIGVVWFVRKRKERKLYRCLVVAFLILLPTWDVVLGLIVYFPASLIIPKVAIYEMAETEGIYYEGMKDYLGEETESSQEIGEYKLVASGWIYRGIEKRFKFIEYISDKKQHKYKCTKLDKDNKINKYATGICIKNNEIESKYKVKVTKLKVGIAETNFKKVIDRSTGKLMAEYKRVTLWSCFPFFDWLEWAWWNKSEGSLHSPSQDERYYSFEYEVLKAKQ